MRDLRNSLPVKAAALFLAVLLAAAAAAAGLGIVFSYEAGFYQQGRPVAFEDTALFRGMSDSVARRVVWDFAEYGTPYANMSTNELGAVIRNEETGEVLFENIPSTYCYSGTFTFYTEFWNFNRDFFRDPAEEPSVDDPTADGIAADDPTADSGGEKPAFPLYTEVELYLVDYEILYTRNIANYHLLYETVYPVRNGLPWIAFFSVLAFFVDLVFLCCAAGHRKDSDTIVPNFQDRIPLDLYLLVVVTIFAIGVTGVGELPGDLWLRVLALLLIAILLLMTGLAGMMTLATRLKLGRIWENTLCCRLWRLLIRFCRFLWRGVKELFHVLPLTYRALLVAAAILMAQSFLFYWGVYDGIFHVMLFIQDCGILLAAAFLSYQLQKLKTMGQHLANGDLDAKIDTDKMFWDIKVHGENLNAIGQGMNRAVEQRMKSERLKTELITNVSHDIKTPLTSIVNYVDLLKKEELPEKAAEYLLVLDRQSNRLKKLTEDLVEASKASTGNIAVDLQPIVVNEIIHQAVGDYDQRLTAGRIEVIVNTFEGNLSAMADGRLLWRVLDNLLSNVCKYAMAGSRLYIDLSTSGGRVVLSMKNISRDPLNVSADELMERFVRGDASRHAEGSGLGLNIAKSLVELMGGAFQIAVDGDLFKAEITLNVA